MLLTARGFFYCVKIVNIIVITDSSDDVGHI